MTSEPDECRAMNSPKNPLKTRRVAKLSPLIILTVLVEKDDEVCGISFACLEFGK